MRLVALVALLLLGGLGVLLWRGAEPGGIDDLYTALFGPPDLGPVAFETLRRASTPNDALACPRDLCREARIDIEPPVYPVEGEALRRIVAEVAGREADLVFSARWEEQDRYVARTPVMRFPDTISVSIVGQGVGRSTLAIYSRSQIGYSDLGVNRARVERWLAGIGAAAGRG